MTEGELNIFWEDADTIGLSIIFCLQQKKVYKKPKKKQKESNFGRLRESPES